MTETPDPKSLPPQPPEDFRWGISYLREDIQDLRQDVRAIHGRIDETNRSLSQRIDETHRRIDSRFAVLMTTMIALTGLTMAVMKILIPSP